MHALYPHHAGYLIGCSACENECHCTPGSEVCVYDGEHRTETRLPASALRTDDVMAVNGIRCTVVDFDHDAYPGSEAFDAVVRFGNGQTMAVFMMPETALHVMR